MALTISNLSNDNAGSRKIVRGQIAFDNSYPTGGEQLTAAQIGLSEIKRLKIQPEQGYVFGVTYTPATASTNILVRFGGSTDQSFSPTLVVEQIVGVASNIGTVPTEVGYLISCEATVGTVTGPKKVVPVDQTPITGQVGFTPSGDQLVFAAADAVTQCRITFIPFDDRTSFNGTNIVDDETVTASSTGVNLSNRAALIQSIYDDSDGSTLTMIPVGEAPGAAEVAVDMENSGNTTLTTNAARNGNNLIVSYFRFSGLGSPDQYIDDADITLSTQEYSWVSDGAYGDMVIPGFGTVCVGEAAAGANFEALWVGPSGTAANNVALWEPAGNNLECAQTAAALTLAMPWVILSPQLWIPPTIAGQTSTEVSNGTDLSALTGIEFEAYGH